jgi:hypothetical protein
VPEERGNRNSSNFQNTVKPGYSDRLWKGKLQYLMMLSVNEEEIPK